MWATWEINGTNIITRMLNKFETPHQGGGIQPNIPYVLQLQPKSLPLLATLSTPISHLQQSPGNYFQITISSFIIIVGVAFAVSQ
jgi:hypothetical protein